MKSCFKVVLVVAILFCAVNLFAQAPMADKAQNFISAMNKGEFQKAYLSLNSDLGFKVTADNLRSWWAQLVSKGGNFVEFRESSSVQKGDLYVVTALCKFEKGLVDVTVAVEASTGKIAGMEWKGHKGATTQSSAATPAAETQPS
ncbi:MAG TPA: DUF3887 domain-containing protein [Acidobacteriota bacterium]|nr:DUF3887 domain-containing protein [Acidobacteriota bacterium]